MAFEKKFGVALPGDVRAFLQDAMWPLVEAHVPVKIPRKKNLWLRYYDAQFKTRYAR